MNHDTNDLIERVLSGLGEATPPPGMERRLRDHLARRMAEPAGRRSLRSEERQRWIRLASGIATGVAAGAAALLLLTSRPAPTPSAGGRAAPVTSMSVPPVLPASAPTVAVARVADSTSRPARAATPVRPRAPAAADGDEALALAELHAPSQTAPPLPLTSQERLLLRAARRNDPDTRQILSADLRAQQEAKQQDDFFRFFGKPVPPPQRAE